MPGTLRSDTAEALNQIKGMDYAALLRTKMKHGTLSGILLSGVSFFRPLVAVLLERIANWFPGFLL